MKIVGWAVVPLLLCSMGSPAPAPEPAEPGLLFALSGNRGVTADFAAGSPEPTFVHGVDVIPDGSRGPGLRCAHDQLLAYKAPGNIYAGRGTLSFFWRPREAVGKTPFPVFRVGYADHSSWDFVWLRIDYNGHGFDGFVTDVNLARVRVSVDVNPMPAPDKWIHLALAWDETRGIRFYVNGALAAKKETTAVLAAGLDQFGPHSRIISPYQVQSAYNFVRGGDIDEVRIYDRMLADGNVANLATGAPAGELPALVRDLRQPEWRDEWWLRYGWNRPNDPPPYLADRETAIRKVEIHDVYDIKRWWWKATDGIRETTWPGVYNQSRLPGRNDYFQLPDWDCYSSSGKAVTFHMPDEPWNHLEIAGAADGRMMLSEATLFARPKGQEKTVHRLASPVRGQQIRFENTEQETPIQELVAFNVGAGKEPKGTARLTYTIATGAEPDNRNLEPLRAFINGRHPADERATVVALPEGAPQNPRTTPLAGQLPLVHVLIPCEFRGGAVTQDYSRYSYTWENMNSGLDGIAIDLPPLKVQPTHGEYFPLNIQIKDPIWTWRNMFDFTFAVKPGEPRTLWLDTRDRLLPNGKSLYLAIAGAGGDFGPASLEGAKIRLIFKERKEAIKEHELDRFTQVRDNYAHLVEEYPNSRRLDLFNRFEADVTDLLRANPDHVLGRAYWYDNNTGHYWHDYNKEQEKPPFVQPAPPPGAPLWAFRQVEDLRAVKRFILWWIDHRQIANGEFGGGLSDDGDLTNWWPGAVLMGCEPAKITDSLLRQMEAYYEIGLFANGLSTIQTDELHTYEEGIQVIPQCMLVDYANPKHVERLMATARAIEGITGVNGAGHRHIRSSYFSGTAISEEGVWEWSKPFSYLILHPAFALVEYNGHPASKKLLLELADGLLAHRKKNAEGKMVTETTINFRTDEGKALSAYPSKLGAAIHLLWAAWRWTGERRYLEPILDLGPDALIALNGNGLDLMGMRETWGTQIAGTTLPAAGGYFDRHVAWQMTGDKKFLEGYYGDQIEYDAIREYINTEGSLWIDRVQVPIGELQRSRLGGVALMRIATYPGHAVSWEFAAPATEESVAILIPNATPTGMKIVVHALDRAPVKAVMTAWDVEPGTWDLTQGIDTDGDDAADGSVAARTVKLERTGTLDLTFPPGVTTVLRLRLKEKGTPYWSRPDLGISREDVTVKGNVATVRVHNIGAIDAPATTIALKDGSGKVMATAEVPPIKAPLDLLPKTAEVRLTVPGGLPDRWSVAIDPDRKMNEITVRNNEVRR